jgi:hypothetical protein
MAKQPRLPKSSLADGGPAAGSGSTSPVGYRKPPVHTRFKPGQSGNPKGRRKGQRNIHTVLEEALSRRITIREGNRTRSLTKLDAMILTMINTALKGDPKAQASLITMMRSLGLIGEPPQATNQEPFTPDDASLIEAYFRRHQSKSQLPDSEGKADASPSDAAPPERGTTS